MQSSRSILIGPHIWDELDGHDKNLKSKIIRAFRFINRDLNHPSLQTEIIKRGNRRFYRARVDPQYRIHFDLESEHWRILAIGPHRIEGIG